MHSSLPLLCYGFIGDVIVSCNQSQVAELLAETRVDYTAEEAVTDIVEQLKGLLMELGACKVSSSPAITCHCFRCTTDNSPPPANDAKLCGIYEPPGAMNIPILGYICLMLLCGCVWLGRC